MNILFRIFQPVKQSIILAWSFRQQQETRFKLCFSRPCDNLCQEVCVCVCVCVCGVRACVRACVVVACV
jgi:hypothetical protein